MIMPTNVGTLTIVGESFMERSEIAIRLTEERGRTGYSQADFARKTGISREGLRLYEMGQRSINGEFLSAAAELGMDVQYILTGVRSANLPQVTRAMEPAAAAPININSEGTSNVVQFAQRGATIQNNQYTTQRLITKTKAEVKPGDEHISEAQARRLKELVDEVVKHEERLKKNPKSYKAVWAALNAHCKVTRYRLIPRASFEKAEKYLLTWIGRLNQMKTAPVADNIEWRKRRYAYIKINTQDDPDWLTRYLARTTNASSLTELSDTELVKVYQAVARRKQKAR